MSFARGVKGPENTQRRKEAGRERTNERAGRQAGEGQTCSPGRAALLPDRSVARASLLNGRLCAGGLITSHGITSPAILAELVARREYLPRARTFVHTVYYRASRDKTIPITINPTVRARIV